MERSRVDSEVYKELLKELNVLKNEKNNLAARYQELLQKASDSDALKEPLKERLSGTVVSQMVRLFMTQVEGEFHKRPLANTEAGYQKALNDLKNKISEVTESIQQNNR